MLEPEQAAQPGEGDAARVNEPAQGQEQAREAPQEQRTEGEGGEGKRQDGERAEGEAADQPPTEEERRQPEMPAWMQRRMNEMTAARREAERRAAAAEERLARFNQGPGAQEPGDERQEQVEQRVAENRPDLTQEQIRQEAARLVAYDRFNESCNQTFDKGKEQFPDFEKTVGAFQQLGGLKPEFLQDVLEAGNAHMVLHHLGRDLDEADRVMSLPPRQRVVALARLSDKLATPPPPKPISRAPAPIDPVGGAGRPSALNTDPDSLSTAEWMRRRNAGEIR